MTRIKRERSCLSISGTEQVIQRAVGNAGHKSRTRNSWCQTQHDSAMVSQLDWICGCIKKRMQLQHTIFNPSPPPRGLFHAHALLHLLSVECPSTVQINPNHYDWQVVQQSAANSTKRKSMSKAQFIKENLKPNETYVGILIGKNGQPDHHVALLEGEYKLNWHDATKKAKELGYILPDRRTQSLLFANAKEKFAADWYWSSEQSSDSDAWLQHFGYGSQHGYS
jgi:hypothetical protein